MRLSFSWVSSRSAAGLALQPPRLTGECLLRQLCARKPKPPRFTFPNEHVNKLGQRLITCDGVLP